MGNVDGTVIIEARITDDKFKGDVDKLTKELYKYEREAEKLANQKARLDINTQQAENSLEKINGQISLLDSKIKNMQENNLPQNLVGNFDYEKLLIQRDELVRKSDLEVAKLSELDDKQAQLNNKTSENLIIRQMINDEISKSSSGLRDIGGATEKTNNEASKTLKSMTRWGLAIFGIRSAYMGIRQVMNGVFAQNTKLGDQMDAMKKSIAGAFTPIVEKILNLIRTFMAYINYLWRGLFGKNLFSEKVEKNLKSGAKSAKEIRNQLAGFDEANVLSSNSSSGSGVGGGSTDLKLSEIPIPGWLKWIRDFIEKHPTISKIIFGLAAFTLFGGWKIAGGIFGTISSLLGKKGAGAAATGASGLLGVLGTMLLIAATVVICKITYDKVKEAWKAYKDLKKAIDESNETTEKSLKKSEKRQDEIIKETKALNKEDEQHKRNIETLYKMVAVDDEYAHRTFNNKKNEAMANEHLQKTLSKVVTETENMRIAGEMTDEEQYNHYKFLKTYLTPEQINNAEQLGLTAEQAYNLRNGFKELDKKFETKYKLEAETSEAKDKFDDFVKDISNRLSKPIQFQLKANIIGLSDKTVSALKTLGVFHADGGIVNLPGRGVPIAHYAGEAGREGIIPIDNEGQMALLGSEIAKRVTINLTNVTEMNGRTISKELKRIGSESDFAFNR